MSPDDDNFFSRWSRRKAQVRQGAVSIEPPGQTGQNTAGETAATVPGAVSAALPGTPSPVAAIQPAEPATAAVPTEPPPTLDDVAQLTTASDFRRFVAPGVDSGVSNAALKKLFTDPHFNVMDGLDTYIDDYNKPDPLPASWLKKMTQSAYLGFLADDEASDPALADAPRPGPEAAHPETPTSHEDADLRLQPNDAAGRQGADPGHAGAGEDAGREH
jgi:hypothetical protein